MTDYSWQVDMVKNAVIEACERVAEATEKNSLHPRLQIAAQLLAGHAAAGKMMVVGQLEVKQALTVAEALILCEKDMK